MVFDNPGGGYLIYANLAEGLSVNAFADWDNQPLPFRGNQLTFEQPHYATHILGPFFSNEVDQQFYVILEGVVGDGGFLVEGEPVVVRMGLVGDGLSLELENGFTGKLGMQGKVEDVDSIGVYLYFISVLHEI